MNFSDQVLFYTFRAKIVHCIWIAFSDFPYNSTIDSQFSLLDLLDIFRQYYILVKLPSWEIPANKRMDYHKMNKIIFASTSFL